MKNILHKKIAIIGAGPGGLTLARLLQMKGADVQVYERDIDKAARVQGATLDLHEESGLNALREARLIAAFEAHYRPGAEKLRIAGKDGRLVLDEHLQQKNDISRPEIDRGPLRKILLDSLLPGTVSWNRHFHSIVPEKQSFSILFRDGSRASADLVIGADGARSCIRPYITPIVPFYSGVTVVEGCVHRSAENSPRVHALLKGGKIFAMGDEKTLIVSSKGDGSLVFYAGFKAAESWSQVCGIDFSEKEQLADWFRKDFAGWDAIWLELFENATDSFIPRPQYCMPFDQEWESLPNLTMLGDAAHLMPPYAGEGVNMAMLDALELSRCLSDDTFPDMQAAITAYEKEMRARASDTARITMESTEALHAPGAIDYLLETIGAQATDR